MTSQGRFHSFQNIVVLGRCERKWKNEGALVEQLAPVPGQDTNGGGNQLRDIPKVKPFTKNDEELPISLEDSPGYLGVPRWESNDPKTNNPLINVKKNAEFVTWLFAQRRNTNERVFLKWIKWKIEIDVDFDFQKDPIETINTWKVEKIAEGDGQGPMPPVDKPAVAK